MKRSNRKRHRPEEVVTKLRQADEAPAKGNAGGITLRDGGLGRTWGVTRPSLAYFPAYSPVQSLQSVSACSSTVVTPCCTSSLSRLSVSSCIMLRRAPASVCFRCGGWWDHRFHSSPSSFFALSFLKNQ